MINYLHIALLPGSCEGGKRNLRGVSPARTLGLSCCDSLIAGRRAGR